MREGRGEAPIVPAIAAEAPEQLDELLRVCRLAGRADAHEQQSARSAIASANSAYATERGKAAVQSFTTAIPSFDTLADRLVSLPVSVPGLPISQFSLLPRILRASSGAVAASMCANGADRLCTALDAYWAACNRPIGEGPGVSTQHAPNDSRCGGEELCYKAGVCLLHSVEGRRLRSVRNRLVRELLLRCPRGSREFSMLLDGFIVLRWVGKPRVGFFGGEFEGSDDPELVTKYWHVSFFLQCPITPVFMDMQSDETDEALAGEHGVIELVATPGAPINVQQSRRQVRHGVCSLSS